MAGIKLEKQLVIDGKTKITSYTASLTDNLKSIVNKLHLAQEVYQTNSSLKAKVDEVISKISNISTGYTNHGNQFLQVLDETVASYESEDVKASTKASSMGGGAAQAAGAVGGAAGIAASGPLTGKAKEIAGSVTNGVQEQVKEAIATNGKKPITGEVIDSDDPLVKGLANMNGGEVVRMEDGRIAVRDETGSGVIFNKDGTTEAVTTKPTILAGGERTSGNSNGRDPYTQEVAQVLRDEGYSDKQVDKFINSVDKKMDKGTLSEELSIDTGNLRDTFENGPGIETGPGVSAAQNTATTDTTSAAVQAAPVPEVAPEPAATIVEGIHGGPGVTVEPGVSPTVEASQPVVNTTPTPEVVPEPAATVVEGANGGPGVSSTVEAPQPAATMSTPPPQPTTSESPVVTPTQYVPAGDTTDDPTIW